MRQRRGLFLRALEAFRYLLPTVVKEQAEVDGNVELDPQDIGLECSAEAHGSLEVDESFEKSAAGLLWWLADVTDQDFQNVGAHTKLKGVHGALALGRAWAGLRGGWARARPTGTGQGEEEEVEGEEEGS